MKFIILFICSLQFCGCFVLKSVTGTNIDIEELSKAREVKVAKLKYDGISKLNSRLQNNDPIENADLIFYFSESLLNKTASQLDSVKGWVDSLNSYSIKNIRVKINDGSALGIISVNVFNLKYNVSVDLLIDCVISFKIDSNKLFLHFEPFNIIPFVEASGLISIVEDVIADILTVKLSNLNEQLPLFQIPIDFNNQFNIIENKIAVRNIMNMDILIPQHQLKYAIQLKEVLLFKEKVLVAFNINNIQIKR